MKSGLNYHPLRRVIGGRKTMGQFLELEDWKLAWDSHSFVSLLRKVDSNLHNMFQLYLKNSYALWSRIIKNPDESTGPLTLPFACTAHFFACLWKSG